MQAYGRGAEPGQLDDADTGEGTRHAGILAPAAERARGRL